VAVPLEAVEVDVGLPPPGAEVGPGAAVDVATPGRHWE